MCARALTYILSLPLILEQPCKLDIMIHIVLRKWRAVKVQQLRSERQDLSPTPVSLKFLMFHLVSSEPHATSVLCSLDIDIGKKINE